MNSALIAFAVFIGLLVLAGIGFVIYLERQDRKRRHLPHSHA
ncbi:MAG: hypothetical protein Q8O79_02880 [Pseudomonadota bacterium]|nr:hypothetical protein [Pseudomonadota bacterium]